MNPTARGSIAEFVGTFALTFIGAGAIIVNQIISGGGLLPIAIAHGLTLAVMVSATMHISGGQINPAVSIALAVIGKQDPKRAAAFVFSQLLGATVAALLLKAVFTPTHADAVNAARLGATLGGLGMSSGAILVLEIVASFFLMFVIIGTAVDSRGVGKGAMIGGFGIGLTIAADILAFGPATGASMNPARSFGPALIGGYWDIHWVYWLGPIAGAILAALVWQVCIGLSDEK